MKTKFKLSGRRILSAVLCLLMMVTALPMSAFAWTSEEGHNCTSSFGDRYVGSDGEHYYSKSSYSFIAYDSNGNISVHPVSAGNAKRKYMMNDSNGAHQVYCVESGIDFSSGNSYVSKNGTNSSYFQNLPIDAQFGIMMALMYGWHEGQSSPVAGTNADDYAFATQTIIWEYQQQLRTSPTDLHSANGIDADTYCYSLMGRPAEKCYNWILSQMADHYRIPSFMARSQGRANTYTLKYNPNAKNYSLTLTDTNNTLSDINLSANGIRVSRNGNQYTFTSDSMITSPVAVSAQKNVNLNCGEMLIWGCVGKQTMISGASDPVYFYLNIDTETYGIGHIQKTSEDGVVSGISFNISGNGVNKNVTTNADGTVDVELMPGVYTVTEQSIPHYEPQNVQRVTIVSGHTSTVTFSNVLKRGDLTVTKTSEDGLNEGVKFHLSGTSLSGLPVDEYAVTDSTGKAYFRDVLIGSGYVLSEVDTAIRYVVPDNQEAAIEWNKVTEKGFYNALKKFQVTVTKSDSETGTAQGDASLSGAVYGIYKGDQLIDTYTTDANGQFTTDFYICDYDWTIREISPSEGYLLNDTVYPVGAEPELYTVEYNATANDVLETVQKGKIALIKHCDDGETQIETPETGAEFEVFLKSSGSYEAAKESERDYIVCDENGFAETKELPYGIYTVRQTKGWEGKELLPPFDVFVKEDGEVYRYLINNATFEALIEIVKKDIETGKTIPASGIGFKLRNTDTGEYIVQHINYPTPVDIDIYYTDSTGKLMMPEALPYGNYEIIEQNTCYGYVLDSNPVPFTVDGSKTVVTVEKHNIAQKGTITVSKSGEIFDSVAGDKGFYHPIYAVGGLAGAVYEITAAEDIYTLDGTLRYSKGEVVATIETDSMGAATTEPLYLGKFEVREIKAPYGMIISDEVHPVELTYAGQEVEITETATAFYNERQRVQIDLSKVMAQDERFSIGMNGEILSVQFGLFAAEDLTSADGSVIPADGLMEIVSCDENGKAVFTTDVPVGAKLYVKEIATNEHYILSDEKYPVNFEYAGQDTATVSITVNNGEAIPNDIIYGNIKGLKIDRETEETIAGALFGLFRADETEFTAEKAILTAESGEDGIFTFENVPYGNWIIKELAPAESFLLSEETYPITVTAEKEIIEITVVNDRIPEIGTTAAVDGEKEIFATEVFVLTDIVAYQHLIPGKEYTVKGTLMDKSTGKPLLIDGEEIHAETVFTPETPAGETTVEFTFDSKYIKADTDIVVFESLYKDGKELAVHADIDDEGQTVKVKVPEIGTQASIDGKKEVTAKGTITIEDIVSYKNLTPGKEYTVKGTLMDKSTGKPFVVDGNEISSSYTFKPETADGEVRMTFTFDAGTITKATEIVVFESVYRDGAEVAVHADINDEGQTVKLVPPTPDVPQTGDDTNLGFWIGLGAIALGGLISCGIMVIKRKKDDDDE